MARTKDLDDYEDDDFDELASSDDEYEEGKKDNKPSAASLIIKGALDEPRFKTMSVRQLYDLLKEPDLINLCPDYQRDVVWPDSRQFLLIQSIFQHYFMPPVIFGTERDDEGFDVLVCIDGKQRCTSIRRFMDGEIPFIAPGSKEKYWYKMPLGKTSGKLLPKALKVHFDSRQIQMVEYSHLSSLQQRDIFQRVQMGMPLSAAEKLQALPGEWGRWINSMEKKYIKTLAENLEHFDITRGRPFQLLASVVLMVYETKASPSASTLRRLLTRSDHPERSFRDKVEMAMRIFVSLACDHYDRAFGTVAQRLAPVEFCGIAYLIYKRMNSLSIMRLADEATRMRQFLRERHVDIRSNTKLFKDIYEYVTKVPAGKIGGEPAAREMFDGTNSDDEVQQQRVRKRQREEDRDETYHGTAADRDEESAVVGGLRSKKTKDKSPSKTKSPNEPSRAAKAGKIPKTSSTSSARAAPAVQHPAAPPSAYPVEPNFAVRPTPINMDAPNRGPAFAPAPRSPPRPNSAGFSAYQPNVQSPYVRSPPLPQGQYGRSPPHPTSHRQSLANQGGQGHGGYQQPPYGSRR